MKKVAQSYGLVKNDDDIAVLDKKDIKNYMDLYASDESDDSVIVESEGMLSERYLEIFQFE